MTGWEIPAVAAVAGTFGLGCAGGIAAGCMQASTLASETPPLLGAALSSVTPSSAIGCWVCMSLTLPPFPGRHFFSCVDNMAGSSARFVMCGAIFVCFSGVLGYCLGEYSGNIAHQLCCEPSGSQPKEAQPPVALSEALPVPPSGLSLSAVPWADYQGGRLQQQLSIPKSDRS